MKNTDDNTKETKQFLRIIEKEVVTLKEFQYIANHYCVAELISRPQDARYPNYPKYIVKCANADSYTIYIKL